MRRSAYLGAATLAVLAASGCESTQSKSARLAAQAQDVQRERGMRIERENADLTVTARDLVTAGGRTAVAVRLRNRSAAPQARVPILLDVRGRGGAGVFSNDVPGLEPSLTHVPLVPGRGEAVWVHDQITPTAAASAVTVRVGPPEARVGGRLPRLVVGGVRLERDAIGTAAVGRVENRSDVVQRKLVLYGVARRGGRVVAAGRAQVARLEPGTRAPFRILFVGDPRGADVEVTAPPSVLR